MATEANKDAAEQSLDIAKSALAAGNLEKAQRFAEKAMKLYPSDEVRHRSINALSHSSGCTCCLCKLDILHNECNTHSSLSAHCLASMRPVTLLLHMYMLVFQFMPVNWCVRPASILRERL